MRPLAVLRHPVLGFRPPPHGILVDRVDAAGLHQRDPTASARPVRGQPVTWCADGTFIMSAGVCAMVLILQVAPGLRWRCRAYRQHRLVPQLASSSSRAFLRQPAVVEERGLDHADGACTSNT